MKDKLNQNYVALNFNISTICYLQLNKKNKRYIKNILARITSFIEERTSGTPNYEEYMTAIIDPYELEHILCNNFERYRDEFSREEFDTWRDSIGALLLLRKSINASLSDSNYSQKLIKYCSTEGNIYAASLGEHTYQNNPRFVRFVDENNLCFKPFDKFGKEEIRYRIAVVVQLVKLIWNTKEFQ